MRWEDLQAGEIGPEFEKANGELHVMRSWMAGKTEACGISDQNGRILWINAAAEKNWGVKLADVRGKTLSTLLDLATSYDEDRHNKKVVRSMMAEVFFVLGTTSAGAIMSYSIFKFPFFCSKMDVLIGFWGGPVKFCKTQ